jgi:tryptophanyl-tRNA synthetase
MVTPLGWLERIPTYKEQLDQIKNKDLHTYGFLGYPTLQTADIVMYSSPAVAGAPAKGLLVPVGEDQVSHVEFSRELVRKFNFHFGGLEISPAIMDEENEDYLEHIEGVFAEEGEVFNFLELSGVKDTLVPETLSEAGVRIARRIGFDNFMEKMGPARNFTIIKSLLEEPKALLTLTPRIPGLDGRKMSKSYNNAITLSESDADIRKKTKVMVTDPARKRRTDPGNPDICPVYDWHKLFSTPERDPGRLDWVRKGCTTAGIGCIECKSAMAENLIKWIEPVRARRLDYEAHPNKALEILDQGSAKARESAKLTMQRVRDSIFNWPRKRAELG